MPLIVDTYQTSREVLLDFPKRDNLSHLGVNPQLECLVLAELDAFVINGLRRFATFKVEKLQLMRSNFCTLQSQGSWVRSPPAAPIAYAVDVLSSVGLARVFVRCISCEAER